ncbi:Immuno-dominant variable surface antigen-like [Trichomonas vaginalis G3]|uniref:Immuno-dominant variable surface antigen-like n=1 Tax=Trichomonas vaginalis (strain ATCC PRA-98 / G3) TaxID=412133 RepID=A2FD97_TRIV3|nr:experimental autoimmune prostatitis antigen 2-related family [Trichomonas vaginalis G3]EAX97099.1 Immuno-dominant variable surface antigen-like [Trichomonas vaginalis G3]KAI5513225.1 experimental autoimmune prostatitis antigen 2-related family [Trichomonas vaginalis G3]|eukprot:XP_001310029.1 Immuno-dominant variable surface antigen-like [Trichomonas vaginalis G3]
MFTIFLIPFSSSYLESFWGHHGTDKIINLYPSSLQPVAKIPKPPTPPNISEAHYTNPIAYNDYPWPGHNQRINRSILIDEANRIEGEFCKAYQTLDPKNAYKHIVGVRQFWGNENWVENATRYKFKFFMNNNQRGYHISGIYVPPGEVITVEIPDNAIGKVVACLNQHAPNAQSPDRLPKLSCRITLNSNKTQFAWPYGGILDFASYYGRYKYGIEITITGGIRIPNFIYGVTTDQEWDDDMRGLQAPLAPFDVGTFVACVPSQFCRGATRVNDAMIFWQTVSWNAYDVCEVVGVSRILGGYVVNPIMYNFDAFTNPGIALSYVGGNRIQAPPSWSGGLYTYPRMGTWGLLHEYHHQFQNNWGWSYWGEVTNNVLNMIDMALLCEIDETRKINFNGDFIIGGGGWNWVSHQYNTINRDDLLLWYGNNLYWFGAELHKKHLNLHIKRAWERNKYGGYISEYLMTAAEVFKRDMRAYYNTFSGATNCTDQINPNISAKLDDMLSKKQIKEFHPVANIYTTGYVLDGVEFETAKPWHVPIRSPYIFDFENNLKTRKLCHTFKFTSCSVINGTLTQVNGSTARYVFNSTDPRYLSKIYVNYTDQQNGDITTMVISVKPIPTGLFTTFYQMDQDKPILEGYADFMQNKDLKGFYMINDIPVGVPNIDAHKNKTPWVTLSEGSFFPPTTGEYRFLFSHVQDVMFWLSDKELTGDLETDAPHLKANLSGTRTWASLDQPEVYHPLEKDKKYYWRLFLRCPSGVGYSNGMYFIKGDTKKYDYDISRVRQYGTISLDEPDYNPFQPQFRQSAIDLDYQLIPDKKR